MGSPNDRWGPFVSFFFFLSFLPFGISGRLPYLPVSHRTNRASTSSLLPFPYPTPAALGGGAELGGALAGSGTRRSPSGVEATRSPLAGLGRTQLGAAEIAREEASQGGAPAAARFFLDSSNSGEPLLLPSS